MDQACLKICLLPPARRSIDLYQRHSDGLQVIHINFSLHSRSVFIITFRNLISSIPIKQQKLFTA